jgi:DNA-binding NarL/FixJ family response regulator
MQPLKVLLVDDNEMLVEAMQRILGKDRRFVWAGWAATREELLERIRTDPPQIVLMDVDMPGVDSFALVRELSQQFPAVKIVMFSGHVRREYADAAVDAGAYGYLSKDDELSSICESLELVSRGQTVLSKVVQRVLGSA